jgi:hypothetical protein
MMLKKRILLKLFFEAGPQIGLAISQIDESNGFLSGSTETDPNILIGE